MPNESKESKEARWGQISVPKSGQPSIPVPTGSAASSMRGASIAPSPAPLPIATKSTTAMPATEDMAPAPPIDQISSQRSSIAAEPIGSDGQLSTGWTESPLSLVEHGSPAFEHLDLAVLPPSLLQRLEALASGRSEPVWAVVQQIAEFFVEVEDERCEGPLIDAVQFYVDNELI